MNEQERLARRAMQACSAMPKTQLATLIPLRELIQFVQALDAISAAPTATQHGPQPAIDALMNPDYLHELANLIDRANRRIAGEALMNTPADASSVAIPDAAQALRDLKDTIAPGGAAPHREWNDIYRDGMREGVDRAIALITSGVKEGS